MRGSSPRFLAVAAGILVLIVVALAFRIVSPSDIVSRDQSRTVSYTVDMAVNGDFVLAVDANGFPATKPPLYNYLSLPLVKAFGPGVWTFTFPSLIAYFATLALVYVIARFTFAGMGSETSLWGLSKFDWATLLAVIFYAISPMALRLALVARPDMVLIFFLTLAFYAATRALALPRQESGRWAALFWVATALSAWDKGPLAFIPIAYGFLAPKVIYDDWRRCDRLWPLVGLPLTLAVGLVWPIAVAVINPEHMFHILLDREIAGQFEGSWYSGILSAWKAPGIIFSRYMPWALLLIPGAIVFPWRRWRTHPLAPCLLYVVLVAIPFIFVVSRRGDRLAPVYPALAVVCAWAALYALRGQALLRTSVAMLPVAAAGFSIYFLYYSIQAKDPSGRHLLEFVRAVKPVVGTRTLVVCPIDNRLLAFQAFLGMNQQGHNPTDAPPDGAWVVAYETPASPAPKVRSGILPIVGGKRLLLYWADGRSPICRDRAARGPSAGNSA